MKARIRAHIFGGLALVPLLGGAAQAQDPTQAERLRAEIATLRAELETYQDQLDSQMTALGDSARLSRAGTNRFVITGYGVAAYTAERDGASIFTSEVAPILLWQLNERLLFSAETEFEMGEELETNVEYAHVSFLATDFLNLGAGKFLTPFAIFSQRLHPAWINKLPNAPLAFGHDGIVPGSGVGGYARGGFAVGLARVSYAVYGINAPLLMTEGHDAGQIEGVDESEERAYGARAGVLLLRSGLEVGYSYQTSDVVIMRGLDVSLSRRIAPLRGNLDARFEGVISQADAGPFPGELPEDPERSLVRNRREGGYAQLAYRPSLARSRFVRNLELVGRYEWMDRPDWTDGERGNDTERYTAGVVYALTPSMQIKLALQRAVNTIENDTRSFLFQVATGF